MVTITSLAKDERSARLALAATSEPDDAVTGRLLAAVGAVETVRLAAGTGAFPKKVDAVEAGLWRTPRMDALTVTQALSESDRLGLRILIPVDDDWPTALNDLGDRAPTALWVRGASSFLTAPLSDRVTITGARAATSYGEQVTSELDSDLTHDERIIRFPGPILQGKQTEPTRGVEVAVTSSQEPRSDALVPGQGRTSRHSAPPLMLSTP